MKSVTSQRRRWLRSSRHALSAQGRARGLSFLLVPAMLVACSSPDPVAVPEERANTDGIPAPDESATTRSDPQAADDLPDASQLATTWEAFHAAWIEQAALDDPDPDAFDGLAADPDVTVELLDTLRAGGRTVTTDAELWPSFDIDGDRAEIVDCAIVTQHPAGQPDSLATVTVRWDATAVATEDGWRIDTARPGELFCIAEDLNDQLLTAYTAWLDGHSRWYQPPDPQHPMLAATMAEPGLSDMRAVLADDRDAGISMRFPHDTQAVVSHLGIETARATDCYEATDGYGAFTVGSGDRRADIVPAPEPGQLNRTVADLKRTAEGWRIVGWRWEEQNDYEPGETRYATR